MQCIVLDAIGAIFQSADDVAELLIPCIAECGGTKDVQEVESVYHDASFAELQRQLQQRIL